MRFYYTTEEDARYLVVYHGTAIAADYYYYRYFNDASAQFNKLKNSNHPSGTSISLYDMKKDVRKQFYRF